MNKQIETELKEYFQESELEWKPQTLGFNGDKPWLMALCYIQARAIQDRLDRVVGQDNWKDSYRITPHGVICKLSIYDQDKHEWIDKENGSQETEIESFKGGISGAFKRVASSGWGIGRYLYELDVTFADCTTTKDNSLNYAKKDGKGMYWKNPSMSKEYLPKENKIITKKDISKDNDTINLIRGSLEACKDLGEFEKVKERIEEKTLPHFEKKGQLRNLQAVEELVEETANRLSKGEKQ
jgi:hypothetical protein